MVKHTQTIRRQIDNVLRLVLKGFEKSFTIHLPAVEINLEQLRRQTITQGVPSKVDGSST